MLYGRKTYEMFYSHWSSFTHNEQGVADRLNDGRKYVLSSTLTSGPWQNTTAINSIHDVQKIKKEEGGYILVQGSGSLVRPLLEEGLVDELRLLVNPAIMGKGERVFKEDIHCDLQFSSAQPLNKNGILLTYTSKK
jgi:dihydrofolate reductase